MSPTARTLAHLRKLGYTAAVVEKWNSFAGIRQDLYNIGDVLAMRPYEPLLLIQCTVTGKLTERMAKDRATCRLWMSTGNRLEFWGWRLSRARGKRKAYVLTIRALDPHCEDVPNYWEGATDAKAGGDRRENGP